MSRSTKLLWRSTQNEKLERAKGPDELQPPDLKWQLTQATFTIQISFLSQIRKKIDEKQRESQRRDCPKTLVVTWRLRREKALRDERATTYDEYLLDMMTMFQELTHLSIQREWPDMSKSTSGFLTHSSKTKDTFLIAIATQSKAIGWVSHPRSSIDLDQLLIESWSKQLKRREGNILEKTLQIL